MRAARWMVAASLSALSAFAGPAQNLPEPSAPEQAKTAEVPVLDLVGLAREGKLPPPEPMPEDE